MKNQPAAPPDHLSASCREWWSTVLNDYALEAHHLRLLQLAAEAWDRCSQARAVLDAEGLTYETRFGAPMPRPEVAIERDSRLAFARLLRELDLDVEPPTEPRRRPAPLRSNNRRR
jgi:phage terminase small subunit